MCGGRGVSADTSRTLRSARSSLRDRLSKFRTQQAKHMSLLEESMGMADGYEDTDEEDEALQNDEDSADESDAEDDEDVRRLPKQGPELELLGLPSDLGSDDFERTHRARPQEESWFGGPDVKYPRLMV